VNAPEAAERLLRRLRVHVMLGGLLDEPALIGAAASDAGLDPAELERWGAIAEVERALRADIDAARSPARAACALEHKLGGPSGQRRYTAPSYEITEPGSGRTVVIPGFNPVEAYETAIANLAPDLVRRPEPETVEVLLAWAGEPLATAEVAAVAGLDPAKARVALGKVARPVAAGADFYWSLAD
jgi:hypothetical protein